MRAQSAPVPLKPPAAVVKPAAGRNVVRALFARPHQRAERLTTSLAITVAVVLLVGGVTYYYNSDRTPPVPEKVVEHPFVHGRNARIVIPTSDDSGICREHVFDNDRGVFGEPREVPCGQKPQRGMRGGEEGFSNFKQAFGGKK